MTATKSFLFFLFPVAILFLCLLHPVACTEGVRCGLDTVLFSALPALFPSLVLSRMIALTFPTGSTSNRRFFPLIMGILCGFPVGAHTVTELVRSGGLKKKDGEKLLFFCNLPGPCFLILLCGKEVLGQSRLGWFLFLYQTFLALLSYLFFFGIKQEKGSLDLEEKKSPSLGTALIESLSSAMDSFLYISSCILFFSFLGTLGRELIPCTPFTTALLSSFLELTSGAKLAAALPFRVAFPLLGGAIGFGGCSVHLQTLGIIRKAGLSSFYYFSGKCVFSLLCALGAEIFQKYL